MFDYEKMINRAIKFFPTWTDIRKRHKKSVGGKFLSSITEETIGIEKAIKEYKDYYFMDRYENYEIVDFCYCASIGLIKDVEKIKVEYDDIIFNLTLDIKSFLDFHNLPNVFYYENGRVYIRQEKYTTEYIKLIYEESTLEFDLKKFHIWNLYDEFACFVGLQRQPNETNEELYNRMIYFNKNKPNSSEDGLKNAIISELMYKEPNISKEEIIIEKVNETNLRKPYESFNELLELLNKINRDVYKWKRWDLDVWEYDFENYSIEYLPYKWSEVLTNWQNGIGFGNDLKVILSSNVNATDANITLYEKDKETLLAYIRRKNIYKNIKLIFETYSEKLNTINVKYLIKASPMKIIDPAFIKLNVYEKSINKESVNIQNVFEIGKDVVKIENSKITDIYPYKIQFLPKDDNYNMEIYKCDVIYRNRTTKELVDVDTLLKEVDGFTFDSYRNLVSNSVKKTIKSTHNMTSHSNLANVDNGFTISNGHSIGQGAISVNGLGKNAVNYVVDCKTSTLNKSWISSSNCLWQDDKLILRDDISSAKTVEIELTANKLSFNIELNNNLLVYVYNYDKESYESQQVTGPNATWVSEETLDPRKIKILITSVSKDKIVLSNFLYSKYSVELNVAKGKLELIKGELILPNEIYNTLSVTLKSYSSYPPVIKGMYVGRDIKATSFVTDIVYFKNNCERIFDIKSNCQVNLIKVDSKGNPIEIIKDYTPSTSYKAISDEAYIRLNLNQWDNVDSIHTSSGTVEIIEESGKLYYNLKLKTNETVTYITVAGSKKMPVLSLLLYDIIKQQIPTYNPSKDKVYCSKLLNGLAIAISGTKSNIEILKINKEMFQRKNAYKYEFVDLPQDLNVIWGNNYSGYTEGFSTESDFDYISFYPINAQIHTAINDFSLFLNEIKNIKIVNNFEPFLNTTLLNYYTVEPFSTNKGEFEIKFYSQVDEGKVFEDLLTWSIGAKDLYIKYNADLFNKNIYEVIEHTIQENMKLDSYIEIKDQYVLSNNDILYTQKYKIIPPIGAEIIYKTYDGTQATQELLIDDIISVDNYFTKLKYANIDKIFYIKEYYNSKDNEEYNHYTTLLDEGIVVWNNYDNDKDKDIVVHIKYSIKKQIALSYGVDALYDIVPYTIDTYKELSTTVLKSMKNGQKYNLNNLLNFKDCDLVFVSCSEPSFEAQTEGQYLKFNKYADENKLLIRTGYYYINGKEYYLFSNNGSLGIKTYLGMDYKNIAFNNGEIQTYKETNNYVRNSTMLLRGINNLYNYSFTENLEYGISSFNSLTACNSFNSWQNYGCKMKLISNKDTGYSEYALNDVALEFDFIESWGYAFVDLTQALYDTSYINFISYGIDVYLGVEEKYEDIKFNRNINIKVTEKIKSLTNYKLEKNKDTKYYLVIQKNKLNEHSIIDDIVISSLSQNPNSIHIKNVDLLGLSSDNFRSESSIYRMKIPTNKHYTKHFAELCSDGKIRTTSNLDWGITNLKTYESRYDFYCCELINTNVKNDYIIAPNNDNAYLITQPIFLGDPYTIKKLFFKINNIDTDIMTGIKVYIYTCDEKYGDYTLQHQYQNSYGYIYGSSLFKYVKVKLEIPSDKVLDSFSLFAEYRSTKTNPLKIDTQNTGYILSTIFDTQECLNYKVKSINISDVSNINDVSIFVRTASDKYSADVWTEWKELDISDSMKIRNDVRFNNARFFQIKIYLKTKIAYVKFDYIDLEVIL